MFWRKAPLGEWARGAENLAGEPGLLWTQKGEERAELISVQSGEDVKSPGVSVVGTEKKLVCLELGGCGECGQ